MKMEGKAVVLCSAMALLGLLSAATGFAAEATRIKVTKCLNSIFMLEILITVIYGYAFIVVSCCPFSSSFYYFACLQALISVLLCVKDSKVDGAYAVVFFPLFLIMFL